MTPAEAARRQRARKGEGDQLRQEILTAAERLLRDTGSEDAVSIRAVADAVGVTPPSIYRHFPDKTHLLFEVCMSSWNGLADAVADSVADDPVGTLVAQARAYVHFGIEHPEHYRIMFMQGPDETPEHYAQAMFQDGTAFAMLLETVERIRDAGVLRPEVQALDPVTIGLHAWTAVHGITSLLITKPGLPWGDVDAFLDQQLHALFHGLLATGS